jgi:glycosyltransferase involved in cell wall biosynthesis
MRRLPTHLGLNLVYLVPGETGGTEAYAREFIPALLAERPELRITAFVNREAAEAGGGPWGELVPAVTVPVRARRRAEWVAGEQLLLPRLAARAGVDLMHSLANTSPARGRYRRVVTVHDLIHRIHPEAHFGVAARAMGLLVRLAVARADRVIAPSTSSRDDLVRLLGTPAEKVDVVLQGHGDPPASAGDAAGTRARLELGERPIVLSLSAMRPHKNLPRLLEAVATIPAERRPLLVLPGYATGHGEELRRRAAELGLEGDVRFPGWVSAEDLEGLYAAASVFVFPSLYEGFGAPVLEAMARGVPVACSPRGSLAEVAGDAARLFDPERPTEIAAAIEALLADPAEAERLRVAGRERAGRFTWAATARGTLAAYERALAGPGDALPVP